MSWDMIEDKLSRTFATADNTFWDNWHTMESLASPYIITAANVTLSDDDRRRMAHVRGLMCHLMGALMAGDVEKSSSLYQNWEEAYARVPVDEATAPLWNQLKRLFRMSKTLVSVAAELKEVTLTEESVPQILEEMTDFLECITSRFSP